MNFQQLISAEELTDLIAQRGPLRILDCRARLDDSTWGARAFARGHIPGASHLSLEQDLSELSNQGGRHPLPERDAWLHTVRSRGILNNDQVVVYDDAGGTIAARAWWMMRWLGHPRVAVLDGGLPAWTGPLSTHDHVKAHSQFQARQSLTRWVDTHQLETLHAEGAIRLIDARARARFAGEEEPIDPVAGHIPGAISLPCLDNLDSSGHFKSAQDLAQRFAAIGGDPMVCYCGSGITATHNILALLVAGFAEPTLYPASWSGWIEDPSRPVATTLP